MNLFLIMQKNEHWNINRNRYWGAKWWYRHLRKFDQLLKEVKNYTKKKKLIAPTFVVVQSGTKVMETKNVGSSKAL